jgi:hypothetical protein
MKRASARLAQEALLHGDKDALLPLSRRAHTAPQPAVDAAHDLVLRWRFEAGRPVVDGDRRELSFPGGDCPTAAHEIGEVECDRLRLGGQMLAADARTEGREVAPVRGVGPFGCSRSGFFCRPAGFGGSSSSVALVSASRTGSEAARVVDVVEGGAERRYGGRGDVFGPL